MIHACTCCCTDAISSEAEKRKCVGSYPGGGVEKRSTGGHAWGCTQERRHSPHAGTGCQGAPASVGACLLSRGPAAASSPRCARLSGQEYRHGHTSHRCATTSHIGRTAHGLTHAITMACSHSLALLLRPQAWLRRRIGMVQTQDAVASHRRHKAQFIILTENFSVIPGTC